MVLAKRLRAIRKSKRISQQKLEKRSGATKARTATKDQNFVQTFRKLLPRMNDAERLIILGVAQSVARAGRRIALDPAAAQQKRLINMYHRLLDKQLEGTASQKELSRLDTLERAMQAIEDAQSAKVDEIQERRHNALIKKLSALIQELRNVPPLSENRTISMQ